MTKSAEPTTVTEALTAAVKFLTGKKISGAHLDAELLLGYVMQRDRAWLKAHDDAELTQFQVADFEALISRRSEHIPIVHLTGTREFYGLDMAVTPDVLTPRMETEQMVEWATKYAPRDSRLIDVGTGSGAIAVAIGVHRPDLAITGTDISERELAVAQRNAKHHGIKLELVKSDLWSAFEGTLLNEDRPRNRWDTVVTNLPYLADDADLMPEVRREPAVALFGGPDGLDLYRRFLAGIPRHLAPGGYLFTECDPWQHEALISEAAKVGLKPIEQGYFILGFQRQPVR
jgi:release factor glutamine methyltransferase